MTRWRTISSTRPTPQAPKPPAPLDSADTGDREFVTAVLALSSGSAATLSCVEALAALTDRLGQKNLVKLFTSPSLGPGLSSLLARLAGDGDEVGKYVFGRLL